MCEGCPILKIYISLFRAERERQLCSIAFAQNFLLPPFLLLLLFNLFLLLFLPRACLGLEFCKESPQIFQFWTQPVQKLPLK
jgi:hypothetical protein